MTTAVQIDDVSRRFDDLVAVDHFDLEVAEGEVVGLLGHNGAGKTTLIRLVNGLLPTHGGSIRVFGLDPMVDGAAVRSRTGVLTTYPALEDWLTPIENLAIHASVHGVPTRDAVPRMRALLEQFEIDPDDPRPSRGLSAGQKQRVALARALIHDPDVLLLDEPTANLDPIAAREVRNVIQRLSRERGRTVIMSTHNLAEATAICDRVAVMREGRLLGVGTIDELAATLGADGQVTIEVPYADRARAVAALEAADIPVRGIKDQVARLEDVYLRLHESGARPPTSAGAP